MSKARNLANLLSSAGKVEVANIDDGAITSDKLAAGAAIANIGFTPANIAGATFTGAVNVTGALVATGDVTAFGTI